MTQLVNRILLSISLITTGSALHCYTCKPNKTLAIKPGESSCVAKKTNCKNASHCLSIRRTISNSVLTYKTCAESNRTCVSAHVACLKLLNSSKALECKVHCCDGNFCNLEVYNQLVTNGVSSVPVSIATLMMLLWHLHHLCDLSFT